MIFFVYDTKYLIWKYFWKNTNLSTTIFLIFKSCHFYICLNRNTRIPSSMVIILRLRAWFMTLYILGNTVLRVIALEPSLCLGLFLVFTSRVTLIASIKYDTVHDNICLKIITSQTMERIKINYQSRTTWKSFHYSRDVTLIFKNVLFQVNGNLVILLISF